MKDMLAEQARFNERRSFAYAVLTPDGTANAVALHPTIQQVGLRRRSNVVGYSN